MIQTSRQLKALVKNRSGGNSAKAQAIIRNYIMERFLERIALSKYKEHFILKGGMLISALVGLDNRSTIEAVLAENWKLLNPFRYCRGERRF